jgi:hypothetical protein
MATRSKHDEDNPINLLKRIKVLEAELLKAQIKLEAMYLSLRRQNS